MVRDLLLCKRDLTPVKDIMCDMCVREREGWEKGYPEERKQRRQKESYPQHTSDDDVYT